MKRSISLGIAAVVLQAAIPTDAVAAPVRWSGNGHLYEVFYVPSGVSWVQALLRSDDRGCGWYLATITSAAENAFVFRLAATRPEIFAAGGGSGPWLGAFQKNHSVEPGGNWRWVTNEPFDYTNWNPGEPNDTGAGPGTTPSLSTC